MHTNFQQLYRFNRWANRTIVDACRELAPDQLAADCVGTYGRLDRTLAHLAAAEAGYVHRLTDEPRVLEWDDEAAGAPPSVATVAAALEQTGARLIGLAATIPDDFVASYVNGYGDQVHRPGWLLLAQSVDHAREHRSHIATILTQLGIRPPDIDVWSFDEAGADAGLD